MVNNRVNSPIMNSRESAFCWILAFSLSWTNLSNGWMWITYASISDFTAEYYQISLSQVNWISLLYAIVMTVGIAPFIWFIDYYGVKPALIISSVLNLLCSSLHLVSSSSYIHLYYRYTILIIGSVFGGIAQPLCLFSSTKLAATWFTPENRISANTFAAMGNPLGVLISNILSPLIVTDKSYIHLLNLINMIPSLFGIFLVLFAVYCAPQQIHTAIIHNHVSFKDQIKLCVRNINLLILGICFSVLIAMFTTISTLIQQILCPLGYSDIYSGSCGALLLFMGIPGVLIVGPIITRTNALKEIVKGGIFLTTIGIISFSITSTFSGQHVLIALSLSIMGLFGFGIYPASLELAAETAYPAGEIISTGFLITLSQMLSFIFIIVAQVFAVSTPYISNISRCSVMDAHSYWIPNMVLAIISLFNASMFLFLFNTDYKRVQSELNIPYSDTSYIPLMDNDKVTPS